MKFNWAKFGVILLNIAKVAPIAVAAAQGLAAENDAGATKMQMAQDSLATLTGLDQVAATTPEEAAQIDLINKVAANQLQGWVDIFKQHSVGTFKPSTHTTQIGPGSLGGVFVGGVAPQAK